MYADYAFYSGVYGGSAVSEGEFPRLAAEASAYIDRVTFGRAEQLPEKERLQWCCCDLVELLHSSADTGGAIKQSESVGSWSYSLNSAAADKTVEDFMYMKCRTWLPAEWLYRGVGRE